MLLTRAPLNQTSIATYLIPCDLHVLNTPPAFVLSQNQTLRKSKRIVAIPCGTELTFEPLDSFPTLPGLRLPSCRLDRIQVRSARNRRHGYLPPSDLFPSLRLGRIRGARGALFNLFPRPGWGRLMAARPLAFPSGTLTRCQRSAWRGDEKADRALMPRSTVSSLGRPASWRPAKLVEAGPAGQHLFSFF